MADGAAIWTKPRSEIKPEEYTDFYRNFGAFDEPALTVHYRAEGRHEFTALAFVPSARPFDLYDHERKGRMKLYVKRVFIADDAEILPHYLRFVRGLVDCADLPLSLSREMIQKARSSPPSRRASPAACWPTWKSSPTATRGLGQDLGRVRRRDQGRRLRGLRAARTLLKLARFRTTTSTEVRRSLKDDVADFKPNQTAIYYIVGDDLARSRPRRT